MRTYFWPSQTSVVTKPATGRWFRRHGRRIEKSVWRHNFAWFESIWMKLDRSIQITHKSDRNVKIESQSTIIGWNYVMKSQILNKQNCTQFYSRIQAIALKLQIMKMLWYCSITNHICKLLHLYQMIGWYKCASLRRWFLILYYHKIFYFFAVLEWWLIFDCETECSFCLFNIPGTCCNSH